MTYKAYSGVGSRETPDDILHLMENLASNLAKEGWTLRSGGADGADNAFRKGAVHAASDMEIYLPWDGFNGQRHNPEEGYFVLSEDEAYGRAKNIVSEIHPAWDKLTRGPRALHTRNVYQVLGRDLNTPSKFLVCYSKPYGNSISGGTRTAWEVAKRFGVPCFNLLQQEIKDRINKYVEEGREDDYLKG